MKIDFGQTKVAVKKMLDETLTRFAKEHPNVEIRKLSLWGYGFGKTVHVLLDTSDNHAVFGGRHGEYNDNEFGKGVSFDKFWPNLYECEEDEPYEILHDNGKVVTKYQSRDGNDAIDKPLFALLKEILRDTDVTHIKKSKPLVLAIEMGSSPLQTSWKWR